MTSNTSFKLFHTFIKLYFNLSEVTIYGVKWNIEQMLMCIYVYKVYLLMPYCFCYNDRYYYECK